jgi:heme-degrading monooxygenase HmoA
MEVILFRSRLTEEAGDDYVKMDQHLEGLVKNNPGFIEAKSYKAADGERLTIVWFRDAESLKQWRELADHKAAQNRGREKWYEFYKMDVATVTRSSSFDRATKSHVVKAEG